MSTILDFAYCDVQEVESGELRVETSVHSSSVFLCVFHMAQTGRDARTSGKTRIGERPMPH